MSETVAVSKVAYLNGTLKRFMFAMLLANIAVTMYDSLLPLYLKQLNANIVQVGLFFTLAQIIPLALQILGGWISDSLGRLRSIAWGSMAGVFSFIGIPAGAHMGMDASGCGSFSGDTGAGWTQF